MVLDLNMLRNLSSNPGMFTRNSRELAIRAWLSIG